MEAHRFSGTQVLSARRVWFETQGLFGGGFRLLKQEATSTPLLVGGVRISESSELRVLGTATGRVLGKLSFPCWEGVSAGLPRCRRACSDYGRGKAAFDRPEYTAAHGDDSDTIREVLGVLNRWDRGHTPAYAWSHDEKRIAHVVHRPTEASWETKLVVVEIGDDGRPSSWETIDVVHDFGPFIQLGFVDRSIRLVRKGVHEKLMIRVVDPNDDTRLRFSRPPGWWCWPRRPLACRASVGCGPSPRPGLLPPQRHGDRKQRCPDRGQQAADRAESQGPDQAIAQEFRRHGEVEGDLGERDVA